MTPRPAQVTRKQESARILFIKGMAISRIIASKEQRLEATT
jgi:hypothetical protein